MIAQKIDRHTRYLGPPPNFDQPCGRLAIRDHIDSHGTNRMVSSWMPTPAELAMLNAGGSVILEICGEVHPPVSLYTAPVTL